MNPNDGGQSSSDLQRRAAANIARRKVLEAYANSARRTAIGQTGAQNSPLNGVRKQGTVDYTHLKSNQTAPRIDEETWRKYHTAWQDYYQKYYSSYYSNAARQYIAKERLKDARDQAEDDNIAYALARAGSKDEATGLKMKIQEKASDNAKRHRHIKHFAPIIAGVTVVLVILFLQYNRLIFAPIMAYVSPGNAPATEIEALDPTITQTISPDPRLLIPKLNIDVPIRFEVALDDVMAAMNNGVAHYRISGASAYPGEIGNFIITGHSAGDIYSSNPYKYIFSGLERLDDGDLIYVNYQSVRYTYRVAKKEIVEPSNVQALIVRTDKPLITLVTCTPVGTSRYRLLVTGEQISPSYEDSARSDDLNTPVNDNIVLPANEPSFFEGIWNWLTGN